MRFSQMTIQVELPVLQADQLFQQLSAMVTPMIRRYGGGEIGYSHSPDDLVIEPDKKPKATKAN